MLKIDECFNIVLQSAQGGDESILFCLFQTEKQMFNYRPGENTAILTIWSKSSSTCLLQSLMNF